MAAPAFVKSRQTAREYDRPIAEGLYCKKERTGQPDAASLYWNRKESITAETFKSHSRFRLTRKMELGKEAGEESLCLLEKLVKESDDPSREIAPYVDELTNYAASLSAYLRRIHVLLAYDEAVPVGQVHRILPELGTPIPAINRSSSITYEKKLKFANEKDRAEALGALVLESNSDVLFFPGKLIGLTSSHQVDVLKRHNIPYEELG